MLSNALIRQRGENMWFQPKIFIVLILVPFCSEWHKNMSFNSWDPDLYDHVKITFIHPVINAQWHAKVQLPFFGYTLFNEYYGSSLLRYLKTPYFNVKFYYKRWIQSWIILILVTEYIVQQMLSRDADETQWCFNAKSRLMV